MRDLFPGYSKKSEEEIAAIWQTATFVFDTNVLLHAYRYKLELQTQLLDYWQRLRERVWLPHQVALEYHRNAPNAIMGEQLSAYKAMKEAVTGARESLVNKLQKLHDQNKSRYLSLDPAPLIAALQSGFDMAMQLIDDTKDSVPTGDAITQAWERIDTIFAGRVGDPFSPERQARVYQESEYRYRYQIPPGFADESGKEGADRYGDVILWLQTIDFAKDRHAPIIFVTDDAKIDWWEDGKPHRALAQEMYERAGVALLQLRAGQFLNGVRQHLNIEVEQEVIDEADEVREEVTEQKTRQYHDSLATSAWGSSHNLGNLVGVQDSLASLAEIHGVVGKQGSYATQMLGTKSALEKFVAEAGVTTSAAIAAQAFGIVGAAAQAQAMLRAIDQSSTMMAGRAVQQINEMQLGYAQRVAQDLTNITSIIGAQPFTPGITDASAAALAFAHVPANEIPRAPHQESAIDPPDEEYDPANSGSNNPD